MYKFLSIITALVLTSACVAKSPDSGYLGANKPDAFVSHQSARSNATTFHSVQAAIDAAPEKGGWLIAISEGEFKERLTVNKPNLTLVGAGPDKTRIVFDRYAGQPVAPGSNETLGTFRTATVEVTHIGVHLANMTIENSFDFLTNDGMGKNDPAKKSGSQAVALKLAEYTDQSLIENVILKGYQDTLYVQGGRSYFVGGEIHGNVDFIFGNGNAYFEDVDIISRKRSKLMSTTGFITAPSTLITDTFGLTFVNCRLLRNKDVPDDSVPLGRPWHPTTTFDDGRYANPFAIGKSTFINTWMDSHIATRGWDSMSGSTKEGGRKDFDPLNDARFHEYKSVGPGGVVNEMRPQLTKEDVAIYSRDNILNGWQPELLF